LSGRGGKRFPKRKRRGEGRPSCEERNRRRKGRVSGKKRTRRKNGGPIPSFKANFQNREKRASFFKEESGFSLKEKKREGGRTLPFIGKESYLNSLERERERSTKTPSPSGGKGKRGGKGSQAMRGGGHPKTRPRSPNPAPP